MHSLIRGITIFVSVGILVWLMSFGVEALRSTPKEPTSLSWSKESSVYYAKLNGVRVRYVKAGTGPDLVLLHTLRTQLDIYHKMIPDLAKRFTVYAPDYPGHGWSDIPNARYHPDDFYAWVEKFLEEIGVQNATLAGISIGGTIALELAARQNPHINRVVAINPYDYPTSYQAGLKGSSLFAKIMFTATDIPFVGEAFMRLRNPFVERKLFEGGVAVPSSLSDALYNEFSGVGNRPGHYQGFINLLRHEHHWPTARQQYAKISTPVLLVYGDQDWAPEAERKETTKRIPGVRSERITGGGHFLSLDKPSRLTDLIIKFAAPS